MTNGNYSKGLINFLGKNKNFYQLGKRFNRLPNSRCRNERIILNRMDAQQSEDDRRIFSSKTLINWTEGEKYFKDCLLDYNEANNVSGWQWVAGCGADAAPYFKFLIQFFKVKNLIKRESIKKWVPN